MSDTFQAVYFTNPGEIDIEAALTMGVNAKIAENNPIGYFGTGLKYAIAVLLRSGHQITIASGVNLYVFTTEKKETRGTEYELVLCNGEKTGFTTNLGKNWEIWMAYRELYCNARDENGAVSSDNTAEFREPKEGKTIIAVNGFECLKIHENKSLYFLESPALFSTENCEIHESLNPDQGAIFYKGIMVDKPVSGRAYSYNILSKISLTEDRTLASNYEAYSYIAKAIALCENETIILRTALNKSSDEHSRLYWNSANDVGKVFARTFRKLP